MFQGDPGLSFVVNALTYALKDPALNVLHLHYDLVSWDPRGVGLALPSGSCNMPLNSTSSGNATIPTLKRVKERSFDKIYGPKGLDLNLSDAKYATLQKMEAQCQTQIGGINQIGA
jgi:hypothetical protein